jgi:hypothetical protein
VAKSGCRQGERPTHGGARAPLQSKAYGSTASVLPRVTHALICRTVPIGAINPALAMGTSTVLTSPNTSTPPHRPHPPSLPKPWGLP